MKIKSITESGLRHTWDIEVPDVHEYLLSNGCITHNTSGKSIHSTESTEPLLSLEFTEEGTESYPALAPNIQKNREYYEFCYDIPSRRIIEHAAIRQKFIDQSQSVNLYYVHPNKTSMIWIDIDYAESLGMKTLYYLKTPKSGSVGPVCESCT